ncbi:MAG: GNAT family N-acetyltransferase [Gemmatimonadota bacterium]
MRAESSFPPLGRESFLGRDERRIEAFGDGTPAKLRARAALKLAEELLLLRVHGSRSPRGWIALHHALSLPFKLRARRRRCIAWAGAEAVGVECVGPPKRFEALLERLFERRGPWLRGSRTGTWRPRSPRPSGGHRMPAAEAGLRDGGATERPADLVAIDVHRWMAAAFRRKGWLLVPSAVRWVGELSRLPPTQKSHSLREDLRASRLAGYSLEEGSSDGDWREFFEGMVLPHARRRFERRAWLASPRLRRDLAARARLLFVRHEGRRVAGECVVARGPVLWSPLLGIRDGDPELLRRGAVAALYGLVFVWARENGFRTVDQGRTSPFLRDGLVRYKRKWGLDPIADPLAHLVALRVNPRSEPLAAAFAREPLLVESGRALEPFAGTVLA